MTKNKNIERSAYGDASQSEVKEILDYCYQARMPLCLIGLPGVGKTAMLNAYAKEHNLGEPILLIGSQMEPQDVVGLPMASDIEVNGKSVRCTEYGAPWWQVALMSGERKVLFFDEFSNSPATIQSGMLKLIGDKVFGDGTPLPDDVLLVMAMNPENSAVDYNPIAAPMANRITFVSYRPTDAEVYDGLLGEWYDDEVKEAWTDAEKNWRQRIVDFLRHTNGTYILKLNDVGGNASDSSVPAWLNPESENSDSEKEILCTAWPSPRAWDNVARLLAYTGFENEVTPIQERILSGTVGRQASVYLQEYAHEHSMIDPFELIRNPEKQDWHVNDQKGNSYNDILQLARAVNQAIPKCDGVNGRPNSDDALSFYEKVVDLGGGAHFMEAFCTNSDPHGPRRFIAENRPSNFTEREWKARIIQLLIKFREADLIPDSGISR